MGQPTEPIRIESEPIDYITAVVRGLAGAIPFAGGLVAELIGVVIPNQRMDRLSKFIRVLEERINRLDENYVRVQLADGNFSDLLEEAARQAVHSLSDERREYIANIIANSLTSDDIEYSEMKHLLRILNELNDIEIIWLRFYQHSTIGGDEEFRERHKDILRHIPIHMSAPDIDFEKDALQSSCKEHLERWGLLAVEYDTDMKTGLPKYDRSGRQVVRRFELTRLGKMLLKYIGLSIEDR